MTPCCEGATTCLGCGLPWCRTETVSPGEATGLCVDCWLIETRPTWRWSA